QCERERAAYRAELAERRQLLHALLAARPELANPNLAWEQVAALMSDEVAFKAMEDDDERKFSWELYMREATERERRDAGRARAADLARLKLALRAVEPPVTLDCRWPSVQERVKDDEAYRRLDEWDRCASGAPRRAPAAAHSHLTPLPPFLPSPKPPVVQFSSL